MRLIFPYFIAYTSTGKDNYGNLPHVIAYLVFCVKTDIDEAFDHTILNNTHVLQDFMLPSILLTTIRNQQSWIEA